mgnify:CR=1 FL=1
MTTISISQLKTNPSAVLSSAEDYPVAVQNRNRTTGYIMGKDLFERLVLYLEDVEDKRTIEKTDFGKGRDFEDFAKELGI